MDLREAAGALGVHYQTAYAWVRQGILPARKVGRGYAVSEGDVAVLAARRRLGQEPARPIHVRDWAAQARGSTRRSSKVKRPRLGTGSYGWLAG